jgi:uncharacterized membrane protein
MGAKTATKLTGMALALGGLIGVIIPFIRPGGLVVEPLERASRLVDRVQVLADNATFTHTSSLLGSLGLFLLIFGFFGMRHALGRGTVNRAVVTLGVFLVAFGGIGLALGFGLNHIIAHTINHGGGATNPRTLITIAVTIQAVKAGIAIISGYGYLLGFTCIAAGLALHFRAGLHRWLSVVLLVVSVAALISLLIGDHFHDVAGTFYTLADYASMPLSLWALILGVSMYREHAGLTPNEQG